MGLKQLIKDILFALHIDLTKNQQYDRQTINIMQKVLKNDSNCIDVGCHKGEMLQLMLKYSPKGQHHGFEPIPFMYENLKKNFNLPNCHFYNLALSDNKGNTTFNYVVNQPAYSGIKKRNYDNKEVEIQEIKVELNKLDDVIPSGQKITLIKIDVEGAELGVLKGSTTIIKRDKPFVIFEHGKGASDFYGTTPNDIYSLLVEECGMKISLLKDFLSNASPLTRSQLVEQYEKGLNYYFIAHA